MDQSPRAMTERESAVLGFLLSLDDPRLAPLREQAKVARVTARWDCCATIEFDVDRASAHPATGLPSPAVETQTVDRSDANSAFDLILFLDGGWLKTLELVPYGKQPPTEFPTVDTFDPPWCDR